MNFSRSSIKGTTLVCVNCMKSTAWRYKTGPFFLYTPTKIAASIKAKCSDHDTFSSELIPLETRTVTLSPSKVHLLHMATVGTAKWPLLTAFCI